MGVSGVKGQVLRKRMYEWGGDSSSRWLFFLLSAAFFRTLIKKSPETKRLTSCGSYCSFL